MIGYYKKREETEKVLFRHDDGWIWVHSGDLGYMDSDGILFIEGRLKRMIVRHDGFKVYPSLIEKVLQTSHDVSSCCVVGMPDKTHSHGSTPVAYIVINESTTTKQENIVSTLTQLCAKELPEYAQPSRIVIIEKLPLTLIGKIDYRSLEISASKLD